MPPDAPASALALPFACCVFDRDGREVYGNAAFWALAGEEPSRRDHAVVAPEVLRRTGAWAAREKVLGDRNPLELDDCVNGKRVHCQMVAYGNQVMALFYEGPHGQGNATTEYQRLFNTVTDAIYIQDRSGAFLDANEAVVRMYGYTKRELIGNTPAMLADPSRVDLADTLAMVERAFKGEPQRFEWWGRRKNGEVFPKEVVLTPGTYYGRDVVIALARDISERKRSEETLREAEARHAEAERLRALGQLAAGVAHDFNNALTAILGYAQVMKRRLDDARFIAEGLEVIQQAAEGAAVTARRIQSFGRERGSEETQSLDLGEVVRDAVAMTRPRWERDAAAGGVAYRIDVDLPDKPLPVTGNPAELREVFVNLVFNALDAMPQGGRISIVGWKEGELIIVNVTDHGSGLDEATRHRIFEPFFSTKGAGGTGLGLSVSYGIVRQHGGEIGVESMPGQGATFRVVLPRERESQRMRAVPSKAPRAARLLLVDDEPFARTAVAQLLEDIGQTVVAVASGHEALARLEHEAFDVVVTDLSMPEMDGAALVARVQATRPQVRTVVITGYAAEAAARPELGTADAVVGKPLARDALARVLTQVLGPEGS